MNKFEKAVIILAALALLILFAANSLKAKSYSETEIVVNQGDTLWSIASTYCPDTIDKREWIYETRKANGITDAGALRVGQVITIVDGRETK